MGGRGGVQGLGRLSGVASGVMRDIADTLASLSILFCELWYVIVCATPHIVRSAVILRSLVQELHLLFLTGSDQRESSSSTLSTEFGSVGESAFAFITSKNRLWDFGDDGNMMSAYQVVALVAPIRRARYES